ncbi:MAG: MFS transporter [Erysipelotrichaceae bacterium]|jgi:GPH family glycoside/pentoside/hexuronide:cation symporter
MLEKETMDSNLTNEFSYHRAPGWVLAISNLQNGCAMAFYILMTMMSYLGGAGYGIATALIGLILSASRIFDGVIDPFLAVWIDKFKSKYGKLRIMMTLGFVIRTIAVFMLFNWFSNGSHGVVLFTVLYLVNIVGNSIYDIAGNMISSVITNDPQQRPKVGVWATIYNYLFPMIYTVLTTMVLLPKFGNEYTIEYLSACSYLLVGIGFILLVISFIGISKFDKPENFEGISAEDDDVSMKDMLEFLKSNNPFKMYLLSSVSSKLAQNVISQSIITTMLFGILIGNIQFGTMLTLVSMLPSILFAIFGARFAGKHGAKKATVTWTWVCIIVSVITLVFCSIIDMTLISKNVIFTAVFFVMLLVGNGAKMCVTTANNAMRADIVDYELSRSGKYLPAVVTATYNFVDQVVTSFGAAIATGCVALIGYVNTLPQPTDVPTPQIKFVALFLYFGLPIITWIITILAMKKYHLTKEEMVRIQMDIAEQKATYRS